VGIFTRKRERRRAGSAGTTGNAASSLSERFGCLDRTCRQSLWTLILLIAAYALWLLARPSLPASWLRGGNLIPLFLELIAGAWCLRAASDAESRAARVAPLYLGLGVMAFACGNLIETYCEQVLHTKPPFPSWADIGFLAQYPLLFWGVLKLPGQPVSAAIRWRIFLDSLIALLAVGTFSWYLIIGPALLQGEEPLLRKIALSAYPLGDLVLLLCLFILVVQPRGGVSLPIRRILGLGLGGIVAAGTVCAFSKVGGRYETGGWVDLFWPLGYLLIGLAASAARHQPRPIARIQEEPILPVLWRSLLPYAQGLPVGALLFVVQGRSGDPRLEQGVFVGATLLGATLLVRQAVAIQRLIGDLRDRIDELEDSRRMADHDGLTGLLNHRAFHHRLQEEIQNAQQGRAPLTLALIDLNNFKYFNDSYGHLAGDDVLRLVAATLMGCCRPGDSLARFGGDEFALIASGVGMTEATGLAQRLEAVLDQAGYRPPGHDVEIPLLLSVGTATFPDERVGAMELLALADSRLYRAKNGGGIDENARRLRAALARSVAGYSMLDALVTAVDNKDRYTSRHSEDVLIYSLELADSLGLDEADLHTLAVAALLHDIGKIGVPDAIMRKPGKLTDEEFEAMRQHPTMGATIVGAVPGFELTLDAIRHHHERWDGQGYPSGLRGAAIPLFARILAVADAFSAMTTDRPYRKGMSEAEALRLLEEGAGSQWAPDLVRRFVRLRHGDPAVRIPARRAS
jgi:diguanylate cyclase (GGDEF)-like protein